MDSDDLLGRDALRHCHEECERHKLDFAFFDAETILEDRHTPNLYDYRRKASWMKTSCGTASSCWTSR